MSPEAIIYPENLQEILNIVDYAKAAKIGIAVRTGGHQYSGKYFIDNLLIAKSVLEL